MGGAMDVLIKAGRLPEAAFFARAYCPSELSAIVKLWKEDLAQVNKSIADNLADPKDYPDLFPNFELMLTAEQIMKTAKAVPASKYEEMKEMRDLDVLQEIQEKGADGFKRMIGAGGSTPAAAPAATPAPAPAPETVVENATSLVAENAAPAPEEA